MVSCSVTGTSGTNTKEYRELLVDRAIPRSAQEHGGKETYQLSFPVRCSFVRLSSVYGLQ
jgi:hypothetical protein|uniref:Uncharacterized protein n=1 Tax=Picea glauca TaxID=3330 RepID=A0A117NIC5_PICGL|nr:hypothetical protein ABT39_MTgene2985 [Picea glauca]